MNGTESHNALRPYYSNIGAGRGEISDMQASGAWIIVALEIVLHSESSCFLVLRHDGYPYQELQEARRFGGYWALPNTRFIVDIDLGRRFNRSQLEALFDDHVNQRTYRRSGVETSLYADAAKRLAESFGLRDVQVKLIGQPVFEIKPSNNSPEFTRSFYTLRYRLTRVDHRSLINIADYEDRQGFVFFDLGGDDSYSFNRTTSGSVADDPSGTGMPCIYFLGKPLISTLTRMIEDPTSANELLRGPSFALLADELNLRHNGLIFSADISGYVRAMYHAMRRVPTEADTDRLRFRSKVRGHLESHLKSLGTLEIQMAGDGFVGALADWKYSAMKAEPVFFVLSQWSNFICNIEQDVNSTITAGGGDFQIGSRISICAGEYCYGRINGMSSFFSSFDGESIIKAARMEQGLAKLIETNNAANMIVDGGPPPATAINDTDRSIPANGVVGSDSPWHATAPLWKRNHYAVVAGSAVNHGEFSGGYTCDTGRWQLLGLCDLEAKEFDSKKMRYTAASVHAQLEYFALYQWFGLA